MCSQKCFHIFIPKLTRKSCKPVLDLEKELNLTQFSEANSWENCSACCTNYRWLILTRTILPSSPRPFYDGWSKPRTRAVIFGHNNIFPSVCLFSSFDLTARQQTFVCWPFVFPIPCQRLDQSVIKSALDHLSNIFSSHRQEFPAMIRSTCCNVEMLRVWMFADNMVLFWFDRTLIQHWGMNGCKSERTSTYRNSRSFRSSSSYLSPRIFSTHQVRFIVQPWW